MKDIVTIHCKVVVHSVQVSVANLRNPRTLELETEVLLLVRCVNRMWAACDKKRCGWLVWRWGQFLAGTSWHGHKYSSVLFSARTGCQHEGWRGKDTRLASFLLAKGCGCYGTHDPPHKQNLVCLISESKCPCDLSWIPLYIKVIR